MNKKILVSVFLFFFVFSSVMWAQVQITEKGDKASAIEHIVWASTGRDIPFDLGDLDVTVETTYESDPFLTFTVPANPKRDILFFELWAQFAVNWSAHDRREAVGYIIFRLISDAIPANVDVYMVWGVFGENTTNFAGDYPSSSPNGLKRYKNSTKICLRKNHYDWWFVEEDGEYLEEEDAVPYLNTLIDEGFEVEVWARVDVKGVNRIFPITINVEVTRLSKKAN